MNYLFICTALQFVFPYFIFNILPVVGSWHLPYPLLNSLSLFFKTRSNKSLFIFNKDLFLVGFFIIFAFFNLLVNFNQYSLLSFGTYLSILIPFCNVRQLNNAISFKVYLIILTLWLSASLLQMIGLSALVNIFLPTSGDLSGLFKTKSLSPEPSFAAGYIFFFISLIFIPGIVYKIKYKGYVISALLLLIMLNGSTSLILDIILCICFYFILNIITFYFKGYIKKQFFLLIIILIISFPIISLLLSSAFSDLNTFLDNIINSSVYDNWDISFLRATYKLGSWRQISNFYSYKIGIDSFPFGHGLGSWKILSELIHESNLSELSWITNPFSFLPLIVADYSIFGAIFCIYIIFRKISLYALLNKKIISSIFLVSFIDIAFFSPKLTITYWIIIALTKKHLCREI